MSPPTEREAKFVQHLEELVKRNDRAALAALRRGLGKPPGAAHEMHRYVVPFLAREPSREDDAYYLLAALFAYWHQSAQTFSSPPKNLGASFRLLAQKEQLRTGQETDSLERRFVALLNCHADDLPDHLRHAIALLRGQNVPVNWAQLLHDIKGWNWENRPVQREWAREFWAKGDFEAKLETTAQPQNQ